MSLFSERYGYTKPSDVFIREQITPEIQNAICTCYDDLQESFINSSAYRYRDSGYEQLELFLWTNFLNERKQKFYTSDMFSTGHHIVATAFLEDKNKQWYEKLNLIEVTIMYLRHIDSQYDRGFCVSTSFVNELNAAFKRLNFAYRVIDDKIVEITAEEEIKAIEDAIRESPDSISMHLDKALELYSKRPEPDYPNSIKESIMAVEKYCTGRVGEKTLADVIKRIGHNGIDIHPMLKSVLNSLYQYTNQPEIISRHANSNADPKYEPQAEEAAFMLVTCSAFINYLRKK